MDYITRGQETYLCLTVAEMETLEHALWAAQHSDAPSDDQIVKFAAMEDVVNKAIKQSQREFEEIQKQRKNWEAIKNEK